MKNQIIQIPEWFNVGITFKCKWVKNTNAEVISFNPVTNLLHVKLIPDENAESWRQSWSEDGWYLQHTLWGFDNGDYILI